MLGDQKRITTINNLKTINTNIKMMLTRLIFCVSLSLKLQNLLQLFLYAVGTAMQRYANEASCCCWCGGSGAYPLAQYPSWSTKELLQLEPWCEVSS